MSPSTLAGEVIGTAMRQADWPPMWKMRSARVSPGLSDRE
jgi:hypothetical protein